MNTATITATKARNNWFEILNIAYFQGKSFIITKNNLPMIKLMPVNMPTLTSAQDIINKSFGSFKDAKMTEWPQENRKLTQKKLKSLDRLWKQ